MPLLSSLCSSGQYGFLRNLPNDEMFRILLRIQDTKTLDLLVASNAMPTFLIIQTCHCFDHEWKGLTQLPWAAALRPSPS